MKNNLIILFFLIFSLHTVNAQSIKGGVIVGTNISQVDGDLVYGFHKYGLNTGGMAMIPVYKNFSFVMEALYNQKGSYQRPFRVNDSVKGDGMYKLVLNYLDVPMYINLYDPKGKMNFGLGMSYGRLTQFSEWEDSKKVNWPPDSIPYKTTDVDYFFNAMFPVYKGLKLNLRYSYSIASIRTRTFKTGVTMKQYHNLITIRLVYIFGEKPDETTSKKKRK
ncbi:MAG: outer membrane beta-barrel protein [Bacteroidota bacterium]